MKIALVTDSTCDLPCEMVEKLNIHVVPLRIHYSGGEFRDGIDITSRDIINRLEHEVPKTSMPSPKISPGSITLYKSRDIPTASF